MRERSEKFELSCRLRHPGDEMAAVIADADLVNDARAGNPAALAVLLERHRAPLYASALSMLRERDAAQDAVQETFLVALRRLGDLRDPNAAGAWLHTIVRNTCLMDIRRTGRELPTETPARPGGIAEVDEALDRLAIGNWLWTALEDLPQELRVTVMLRYFTRTRSYQELAATLGVPVGTVRSRLNQAKTKLADALLETAAEAHTDHARLADQRTREWEATVDEVLTTGSAAHYAADCAQDVLVSAPSLGYRERGVADHRRGVEEAAAAGVHLRLTGVAASRGVTIVEGSYLNPPHDPHHCPATHTEVRIHPEGQTTRLLLYYPTAGDSDAIGTDD